MKASKHCFYILTSICFFVLMFLCFNVVRAQDLPNQQGIYRPFAAPVKFKINVPVCFDNSDNDQDGLIDMQDPGCESNADNDETDPLAAVPTVVEIAPEPEPVLIVKEVPETVTGVVAKVRENKVYKTISQQVLNNPKVESAATNIAAPVVAVAVAANAGLAINFATLFAYLQGLVTQPFLLFSNRRRKQWGQVYSALTKLPVDLAVVRLFSAPDGDYYKGKLLQTRVTDQQGRYLFLANPGTYVIKVVKPGYTFPSIYLKEKDADLDFVDLYHGSAINVTARATTLSRPIPLDPQDVEDVPEEVVARKNKSNVQRAVAWSGPMLAVASVVITPNLTTISLLALQFILLGFFKRLAAGTKRPKSWGSVIDKQTGQPLAFAIARIFDAQFNKLLETQITDKQGRYAFLVGKGNFYITVEKPGYAQYKSSLLELAKQGMSEIVKQDIELEVLQSLFTNHQQH